MYHYENLKPTLFTDDRGDQIRKYMKDKKETTP